MEKKNEGTEKFTWVSFFEELSDKVFNFRNKQADLINMLKNTGLYDKGLNDKDSDGKTFPMNEIDPFSFFSAIVRFAHEKRTKVLGALKEELDIVADLPTDYDGVPASIPLKAMFVGFKAVRQPTDIPALWALFEAALKNNITDKLFENALNIKHVGISNLTQGLFWVRPRSQFPIDSITTPFLKKHSIDIKCKKTKKYSDYENCLRDIKNNFSEPYFELSFRAWIEKKPTKTGWLKDILKKHCSEERIKFRKKNENELRELLRKQNGQFTSEQWISFFKKLNMDFSSGKITSLRFAQSFTGKNKKLLLEDIDELNKWTKMIWNCPKAGLEEMLDDFWANPISGAGKGFPTVFLYLRDSKAYNIWLPKMQEGLKKRIGKTSAIKKTANSYFKYNSQLIQFRTNNNLEPQTLDIIFSLDSTNGPGKHFICPLNQILYGPPGTGKTYQTVNYALSIIEKRPVNELIEEESLEGRAELLTRFQKHKDNGQIQFITFHQNYAYEDFIQGLRPVIKGGDGTLAFELNDGVFKLIADRALDNYKASTGTELILQGKPPFKKVFEDYFQKLNEGEVESVKIKMKKATYKITEIGNKSISFTKQSGGTGHTLSISTLSEMYEQETYSRKSKGGLSIYYRPLLNELLSHAKKLGSNKYATEELNNFVIIIDEINRANISRVFGELITLIEDDKRYGHLNEMKATLPSGEPFSVPSNLYVIGTMNTADKSIALIDIALRRRFEFIKLYPEIDLVEDSHKALFQTINEQIVELKGPDFQIGHAYFMKKPDQEYQLEAIMNKKIIPLLYEYFMNDGEAVNSILTKAKVKTVNRYGLFEFESYSNE